MTMWTLGVVRRGIALTLISVVSALVALLVLLNLAPIVGHETYAVRGPAMEPTLPVGSLVVVKRVPPTDLAVGEIVSFAADGRTVTRRVTAVAGPDAISFAVVADADPYDAHLVPAGALIGRVEASVPLLGDVVALLAGTRGALGALGLIGGLVLLGWTLDEQIALRSSRRRETLGWSAG